MNRREFAWRALMGIGAATLGRVARYMQDAVHPPRVANAVPPETFLGTPRRGMKSVDGYITLDRRSRLLDQAIITKRGVNVRDGVTTFTGVKVLGRERVTAYPGALTMWVYHLRG